MEKFYRFGWYTLIIAMAGDILVSLVLPCFYKEYSSLKMSISALGNPQSPVRIPFNIWMLIEGAPEPDIYVSAASYSFNQTDYKGIMG